MALPNSTSINLQSPIFIIGPTCVGKSTLARHIARHCGIKQVDLDSAIEEFTGVDIQTIFDYEGEKGFRAYETTCLKAVAQQSKIIATGAGCILAKQNRQIMQNNGSAIYLNSPIEILLKNYMNSKHRTRPLLQNENPELKLRTMNELRMPLYKSIANLEIMVNHYTTSQILEKVVDFLQSLISR